ncbi:hypothetical protein KAX35_09555 [candidate division WOR-3 bacterium]|nr:hypothetical protein [candidate division WOR-3 bacterium]
MKGKKIKCFTFVFISGAIVLICNGFIFAQGPNTFWTKTYGGMEGDEGWSVQETFDGGYIIVGGTQSFGSGNWDIYLIRTEPEGVGIEENEYPRELFYITCCEPNPFST